MSSPCNNPCNSCRPCNRVIKSNLTVCGNATFNSNVNLLTEQEYTSTLQLDGQTLNVVSKSSANPFHGWWASVNKGIFGNFDTDFSSEDIDAVIFIDTTQNPISLTTMGGIGKHFRVPIPNNSTTFNQLDSNTLLSTYMNDPTYIYGNLYPVLSLQSDGTIVATYDAGTENAFGNIVPSASIDYEGASIIYKKISYNDISTTPFHRYDELDYLPPTDYTLPTNLARYVFDRLLYHGIAGGGDGTANNWNPDFIGFQKAEARFKEYLNTGVTYTSTITKISTTKNGSGMTSIYTDGFHYATPGSTVTISGLGGSWATANGVYPNGAGVHAFGGIPNPSPTHVDSGPNGTFWNMFYLDLDSSSYTSVFTANSGYPDFADGSANVALWGGNVATISVTHKITDDMEYPAFIAAVTALFYDVFKVAQHVGIGFWVPRSNRKFLVNSWDNLQALLDAGNALARSNRTRTNRFTPQTFYHNAAIRLPFSLNINTQGGYPWDFNDPYGLLPEPGNIYDYIVEQNYLVDVHNLYYTLAGVPTKPVHSLAGLFGYKNLAGDGTGGSYFTSIVAPMNFTDASAGNPDPNVWTLLGYDFDGDETLAASNLMFGFVNPLLTQGKKVGYIYLNDEYRADGFVFMEWIDFVKAEDQDSPRAGLESWSRVFAPMMIYLNTAHPSGPGLDSIIIVSRDNGGGFAGQNFVFGSLIGAKRHCGDGAISIWRDNGKRLPVTYSDLGYESYNNVRSSLNKQTEYIYADQTALRYGSDAVFSGGSVIYLNNHVSASAGDLIIPVCFLGELNDKQIGASTSVQILGSIDGRLKGGTFYGFSNCMPKQKFSERLYTSSGDPVSAIPRMRLDIPTSFSMQIINGRLVTIQDSATAIDPAPTLTGGAGGNPLPETYEKTVYVDFGFMTPHPDPPLPGWVGLVGTAQPNSSDNTTWRDRWLEQAILAGSM